MALEDAFLQELRMKTEIEQVISPYVQLRKRGRTQVGLCPFHSEKTPSFTVYEDTQSFYCFGCGVGGDAIQFIRKIENLDYMEAVKLLAERANLPLPQEGYDDSLAKQRRRILEANRAAARFFHQCLMAPENQFALDYFLNRGLSMKTIRHFGLGYAPNEWRSLIQHMQSLGFSREELVQANLARRSEKGYYDNFRHRVMTPILDLRQNVVAFGGRVLDDSKPKYINTSDTMVYKKTHEVFALNFAKDSKEESLILCEGYMDVISMHQAGFTNAVACCGTALTTEQVRLMCRYCNEVVLAYDGDEAGRKAVNKAIRMFGQTDLKVRVPLLQGGKDPDEILRKLGPEKMKGMLDGAANDTEYRLLELRKGFQLATSDGKVSFLKKAAEVLAELSPIELDVYAGRLAEELNVAKQSVLDQTALVRKRKKRRNEEGRFQEIVRRTGGYQDKLDPDASRNLLFSKAQERLIALLLFNPDYAARAEEALREVEFSPFYQKTFEVLCRRIREQQAVDLTSLSPEFTAEEIGRLAGIQAKGTNLTHPQQECDDCIRVLLKENQKRKARAPDQLDPEEYRQLFRRKNKGQE